MRPHGKIAVRTHSGEELMLLINNPSTDAYFNLAAEEYLLLSRGEEVFMLWRNDNTVVVGVNQSTLSEINYEEVCRRDVKVVRRMTGGGAVFHDLGNINYTFISNSRTDVLADFRRFAQPITDALALLGVNAVLSGRNDLEIDGKKFSGNAQCVKNGRLLHHGTLLFSSDISGLSQVLRVSPEKISSKGVKSVRSRVTNISSHLKKEMTVLQFEDFLSDYAEKTLSLQPYSFSDEDIRAIERLRDEKYSTWDWNYGSSPQYAFSGEKRFPAGSVRVSFNVTDGKISDCSIRGDFFSRLDISGLEAQLNSQPHNEKFISDALTCADVGLYIIGVTKEQLLECMF